MDASNVETSDDDVDVKSIKSKKSEKKKEKRKEDKKKEKSEKKREKTNIGDRPFVTIGG